MAAMFSFVSGVAQSAHISEGPVLPNPATGPLFFRTTGDGVVYVIKGGNYVVL